MALLAEEFDPGTGQMLGHFPQPPTQSPPMAAVTLSGAAERDGAASRCRR
jgi:hypothetical protein